MEEARTKLRKVGAVSEARARPAEMPWVGELRSLAAQEAEAAREQEARERAAREAANEKRHLEIEELRRQGKWKTTEEVVREQHEAGEAYRRSQQGVLGRLKDLVGGKG